MQIQGGVDLAGTNSGTNSTGSNATMTKGGADQAAIAGIDDYKYTEMYADSTSNFLLSIRKAKLFDTIPDNNGGEAVTLNSSSKVSAQVVITKWNGPDAPMTADFLKR